jgi:hypothetical protein
MSDDTEPFNTDMEREIEKIPVEVIPNQDERHS